MKKRVVFALLLVSMLVSACSHSSQENPTVATETVESPSEAASTEPENIYNALAFDLVGPDEFGAVRPVIISVQDGYVYLDKFTGDHKHKRTARYDFSVNSWVECDGSENDGDIPENFQIGIFIRNPRATYTAEDDYVYLKMTEDELSSETVEEEELVYRGYISVDGQRHHFYSWTSNEISADYDFLFLG